MVFLDFFLISRPEYETNIFVNTIHEDLIYLRLSFNYLLAYDTRYLSWIFISCVIIIITDDRLFFVTFPPTFASVLLFFLIFISTSKNKGRTCTDENHQLQSLKRPSPFALHAFVPLHLHRCATIAIWKLPVKLASRTGIQSYPETARTFPILTVYLPLSRCSTTKIHSSFNFPPSNMCNFLSIPRLYREKLRHQQFS